MSEAEAIEVFQNNRGFLIYFYLLLGSGLACLISLAYSQHRVKHTHRLKGKVIGWQIGWLDFGLFIWVMICGILIAQFIAPLFVHESDSPETSPEVWTIIAGSFIMHLGIIFAFFLYRYLQPHLFRQTINAQEMSFIRAMTKGLYFFLASFPLVWLAGLLWILILKFLINAGWGISLEPQSLINIFENQNSYSSLFLLFILAIIIAPLAEELVFRAIVYRFIKNRAPAFLAMLLSSILFSLLHMNVVSFFSLVIVGISLCLAYEMSGNIMVPVFFHSAFNLNSIILIFFRPDLPGLAILFN